MKKGRKDVLGVCVLGMDDRSYRLISLFLKGPCEGFAQVVDDDTASVDLIDTHFSYSEKLIETSLSRIPQRSVIVLTTKKTERLVKDNVLYLDKPIKAEQMMEALDWANDYSKSRPRPKPFFDTPTVHTFSPATPARPQSIPKPDASQPAALPQAIQTEVAPPYLNVKTHEREQQKLIDLDEQHKKAKYRSAINIEEHKFDDFIGTVPDVNLNDSTQRYQAAYVTKNYYQGYVQFAYQSSLSNGHTLQLNCTIWKPLIILPHAKEIWLDADDTLLKEMANVWLDSHDMSITPVQKDSLQKIIHLEKVQEMNAFLWKLALWTSKGRYPKALDVDNAVALKHWPDFTRYIVTPHALRISGLLLGRGPETMLEIAVLLNIELRYVYVFLSATHALGIAVQAKRQVDTIIKTTLPSTPPAKKGLLNSIISKLRGR
jgi:hypothetical protein